MKNKAIKNTVIYQATNGALELRQDLDKETVWATQADLSSIYEKDQSVISRHIKNIFKDGEVAVKGNMQKMHIANSDKPVELYSLDIILAVGYRTNSANAIKFRKWATKTLKQHLLQGYTINKKRIGENYEKFMQAVADVKALLRVIVKRILRQYGYPPDKQLIATENILKQAELFADEWSA